MSKTEQALKNKDFGSKKYACKKRVDCFKSILVLF